MFEENDVKCDMQTIKLKGERDEVGREGRKSQVSTKDNLST